MSYGPVELGPADMVRARDNQRVDWRAARRHYKADYPISVWVLAVARQPSSGSHQPLRRRRLIARLPARHH
jgi:hypothetical protein